METDSDILKKASQKLNQLKQQYDLLQEEPLDVEKNLSTTPDTDLKLFQKRILNGIFTDIINPILQLQSVLDQFLQILSEIQNRQQSMESKLDADLEQRQKTRQKENEVLGKLNQYLKDWV